VQQDDAFVVVAGFLQQLSGFFGAGVAQAIGFHLRRIGAAAEEHGLAERQRHVGRQAHAGHDLRLVHRDLQGPADADVVERRQQVVDRQATHDLRHWGWRITVMSGFLRIMAM
jgi:hypothetical protein